MDQFILHHSQFSLVRLVKALGKPYFEQALALVRIHGSLGLLDRKCKLPPAGREAEPQVKPVSRVRCNMLPDRILDQFEAAWANGGPPDIISFLTPLSPERGSSAACELVKIDLERRWRSASPAVQRWVLEDYLSRATLPLDADALVELLGWEYEVRNRWGDCPTRAETSDRFPQLQPALNAALLRAAAEIDWPAIELTDNEHVLTRVLLDGPVEVGRRSEHDPSLVSVVPGADGMRLIVAELTELSLSRRQLRVKLLTLNQVELCNLSRNRAVAITGNAPLDAGQSLPADLPVELHLLGSLYLRISSQEASPGTQRREPFQ